MNWYERARKGKDSSEEQGRPRVGDPFLPLSGVLHTHTHTHTRTHKQALWNAEDTCPDMKWLLTVFLSLELKTFPCPRPSVWERRLRAESDIPDSGSDSEMETVTVKPDHHYCVAPETGLRASGLTDDNEALPQKIRELQRQVEVLQLRQRFGTKRLVGLDADVHFYTRFASYSHFLAFWRLIEPAVNSKMMRITSAKTASASTLTQQLYSNGHSVISCVIITNVLVSVLGG